MVQGRVFSQCPSYTYILLLITMFTGLVSCRISPAFAVQTVTDSQVEHIATVSKIDNRAESGYDIVFSQASPILQDVAIGDSICINGACLTVTEFGKEDGGFFRVGLANETLQRTNLGMRHLCPRLPNIS
jgi:riboflavin synthase alpha subunit